MEKIFAVLVFASLIAVGCTQAPPQATPTPSATPTTIGGDEDSHGCLIAAGYSWCEAKQDCLRSWEESCSPGESPAGFSIESNGTCDRQNASSSVRFTDQTHFTINIDVPGSVCKRYGIDQAVVLQGGDPPMPPTLYIALKNLVSPTEACVTCAGVSTATIKGELREPVTGISVELNQYQPDAQRINFHFSDVFCGGIAAFACPKGFECKLDTTTYPDAGGKCVKTKTPSAQVIEASQNCINDFLTEPTFEVYNENSMTYWFTLEDKTNKYPGCSPACVVYDNLTAEINYRCTGLITP